MQQHVEQSYEQRQRLGEDEMTDQELLELAAKAANIRIKWDDQNQTYATCNIHGDMFDDWNPLDDDGDAFRLAVKLSLNVNIYNLVVSYENADEYIEKHFPQGVIYDVAAATRRAIVRVAAEIGREK